MYVVVLRRSGPVPYPTALPRLSASQRSSVVEQRFRKPQVDGSNPSVGSTLHRMIEWLQLNVG